MQRATKVERSVSLEADDDEDDNKGETKKAAKTEESYDPMENDTFGPRATASADPAPASARSAPCASMTPLPHRTQTTTSRSIDAPSGWRSNHLVPKLS